MKLLKVTRVKVSIIPNARGPLIATASVLLNDQLEMKGLMIYQDLGGNRFVAYPVATYPENSGFAVNPIKDELRKSIQSAVLDEWGKVALDVIAENQTRLKNAKQAT